MLRQIYALIKKELWIAKRDPRFLGPSFIVPIVFLSIYAILWGSFGGGQAFECGLVVEDQTFQAEEMAQIIEEMRSTTNYTWFSITRYDVAEAENLFSSGQLLSYIVIPSGFGANVSTGVQANIKMYINNLNDDVVKNYRHRIEFAVLMYNQNRTAPEFEQSNAVLALEENFVLEETPGSIVYAAAASIMLSLMACTLAGQAMATAAEFETKAIYDTVNSPCSRIIFTLGRTIAAVPRALVAMIIIVPFAVIGMGAYPTGNPLILVLVSIFTIFSLVPLGEIIGILTKKKEQALLGGVLLTILGFFAGGGLAPISLLPYETRILTQLLPTTHGLALWNRAFFNSTLNGLLGGFLMLVATWVIGSVLVSYLASKEVERE